MSEAEQGPRETFRVKIQTHRGGFEHIELPELSYSNGSSETEAPKIEDDFAELSSDWTLTAIAFFEAVPQLARANFVVASLSAVRDFESYAKEYGTLLDDKDASSEDEVENRCYEFRNSELPVVIAKVGRTIHYLRAAQTMSRGTLTALFAELDVFFARLLKLASRKQPSAFVTDQRQISFQELRRHGDIETAWSKVIEAEIEQLIKEKSYIELLEWISTKFNVNLTSDKALLKDFVEVSQRRHLLTHAGGIVNERYLENCLKAGLLKEDLPPVGQHLTVGYQYLRKATSRAFQVGYFTLHLLWKKLLPESSDIQNGALLKSSHDFLLADLSKMCGRVTKFALRDANKMSEKDRKFLVINHAQSIRFDPDKDDSDRIEEANKFLDGHDWTDSSAVVQLALACLRGDWSNISELARSAKNSGLDYGEVQTWSIFREARIRAEFMREFSELSAISNIQVNLP